MKNYLDITVVISPGTEGAYAVRVESREGGQGHSTLKLPFTLRDVAPAVFGVAPTARAISSHTLEGFEQFDTEVGCAPGVCRSARSGVLQRVGA